MKRRKFLQFSLLSSSSLLGTKNLNHKNINRSFSNMTEQHMYDWALLYWMPYDNNLSDLGTPIIDMITQGVVSDNLLVAIASDFSNIEPLSRRVITHHKNNIQKLKSFNSASEQVVAEYLDWAQTNISAKKWAVILLGHGGRLNEISPDEHPGLKSSSVEWMNIQKLSRVIAIFNQKIGDRVELVFFQNCNKGTLEAHYTFRDTAKYTLSSQMTLGAPNYYYESLLKFLGKNPNINGAQLAEKIMDFERLDMYHTLTVTNNRYIAALGPKINALIDSILLANVSAVQLNRLTTYSYMGDKLVDVIEFFHTLTRQSGADLQLYNELIEFLIRSVIHRVKRGGELLSPTARAKYQDLSGLGLFLPTTQQQIKQYQDLIIFSDIKLSALFSAILST